MEQCQTDAVSHDEGVIVFTTWHGFVVGGAVVRDDFLDQPGPFRNAALVLVKAAQALHARNDRRPPLLPVGKATCVEEVGFLQFQQVNDAPVSANELIVVVGAQCANRLYPGVEGGLGGRAARLTVVVVGEELAEEPRQRRMDGEPGCAQMGEQASVLGAIK